MRWFLVFMLLLAAAFGMASCACRADDGWFVPVPGEPTSVRNVGGNCGWCGTETCGRWLGIKEIEGLSRGKGGSYPGQLVAACRARGIPAFTVGDRAGGIELIKWCLANDQPAAFCVPGHIKTCCGWTNGSQGERVWIIDNTGQYACRPVGWTRAHFMKEYQGGVIAV